MERENPLGLNKPAKIFLEALAAVIGDLTIQANGTLNPAWAGIFLSSVYTQLATRSVSLSEGDRVQSEYIFGNLSVLVDDRVQTILGKPL